MKRQIMLAETQADLNFVGGMLTEGWILDPELTDGKPYRLEANTVWPMILLEEGDVRPAEKKAGEFDDVVDVKSAEFQEVAELVRQGYVVQSIYAKNTILIKRAALEEPEKGGEKHE